MNFTKGFLLFVCFFPRISNTYCISYPEIILDTLDNNRVEAKFIFRDDPFNNFTDTLSKEFLYSWVVELYKNNEFVFHGKILKADYKMDTLQIDIDTTVGCTDVIYKLKPGDKYGLREHKTKIEVIKNYKNDIPSDTLEIIEYEIYPLECHGNFQYYDNPYSRIMDYEFIYFNSNLSSFPLTGPKPWYQCNEYNGFYIDSLGYISKAGWPQVDAKNGWKITGNSKKYSTGYPGIQIHIDSLEWAFKNYVAIQNKFQSSASFLPQFPKSNHIINYFYKGKSYLINGTTYYLKNTIKPELNKTYPHVK